MNLNDIFLLLGTGILLLLIAILFYFFPPKRINYIYGYRTARSMQDQKHWDYANNLFIKLFLCGMVVAAITEFLLYLFMPIETVVIIYAGMLVVILVSIIVYIEIKLKNL